MIEISGVDYVEQVNNAGVGIYVFLHLYKPGIPQCTLINQHFKILAAKFAKVNILLFSIVTVFLTIFMSNFY